MITNQPPIATDTNQKYKAKFRNGLRTETPIELNYVISLDSLFDPDLNKVHDQQTGDGFDAFVDLVNKHKPQISELNIIFTDYLQRWYLGEERANSLAQKWQTINKQAISKLEVLYKFTSWKIFVDDPKYSQALALIKKTFQEDEVFRNLVNSAAAKNAYKAIIHNDFKSREQAVREYTFEECAWLGIFDGIFTYPSRLNDVMTHIFGNHKIPDACRSTCEIFIEHTLNTKKQLQQNNKDVSPSHFLFNSCLDMVHNLRKCGVTDCEKQVRFFADFIRILDYNSDN